MSYFQFPQTYQQYNYQEPIARKSSFPKGFNLQNKLITSPPSTLNIAFPLTYQQKQVLSPLTPQNFVYPSYHSHKAITRLPFRGITLSTNSQPSQQNIIPNLNNQNILLPSQNLEKSIPLDSQYIDPIGTRRPMEGDHHPFVCINNPDNNNISKKELTIKEEKREKAILLEIAELKAKGQPNMYERITEILKDTFKGNDSTDEDIIIKIIEITNSHERQLLRKLYNQKYNENLISIMQKELNGDFKDSVIGSFMTTTEYDAYCLHDALKGGGSKEIALSEIIGSRTSLELQAIKKVYATNYGETLKNAVISVTSGDYQKLLLALLQCQRSNSQPNTNSCANDAAYLFQAGEQKRGTDEETFTRIFTTSSPTEFALINHFYRQQTGKGLLGAIESEFEFSGDTKELLETIVRAQVDIDGYYAKIIHDSASGSGNNNNSRLIRNICSRYLADFPKIKRAYIRDYQHDMLQDIQTDSSNFRKILCSLIVNANR